jgi:methyl-accepting chemotaxis protein
MARLWSRSFMAKLVTAFVVVGLIPLIASEYLSYYKARKSLQDAEFAKIRLLWDAKAHELRSWLHELSDQLTFMANTIAVRGPFENLAKKDADPDILKWDVSSLRNFFAAYTELNGVDAGLEDFLLVDGESGKVVYTQKGLSDNQMDVKTGDLKDTGLAKVYEQIKRYQKPVLSDMQVYPLTGSASAFVGVPVRRVIGGEFFGALVVRLNPNKINEILSLGEGSGESTEIYIVGRDRLMRSQSRFDKNSTVLKARIDASPLDGAFSGQKGSFVATGYRGAKNFGYAALVGLDNQKSFTADFDWVMIAETDESEAFAPVKSLAVWFTCLTVIVSILVIVFAFFASRQITKRVNSLKEVVKLVRDGDLTVEIPPENRSDELARLRSMFAEMVQGRRDQVLHIQGVLKALLSAVAHISSSISQIASGASETSAAVAQTTITVEQVRQVAVAAGNQSKNVASSARRAVEISESGKQATQETINGINTIKGQIEYVGTTTAKLRDQSQAIENIISFVQDLSNQSNLLAVNASIEAARAGEQGKGFSVVAHEIKNFASQSKQATAQVRAILEDTRKWIAGVVAATDRGIQTIEIGLDQAISSGQAIDSLSQSVLESARTAAIIETSSEQQSAGVEHVSDAMQNIDQAMKQIADSTSQLQSAARQLSGLGSQLEEMIQQYKL